MGMGVKTGLMLLGAGAALANAVKSSGQPGAAGAAGLPPHLAFGQPGPLSAHEASYMGATAQAMHGYTPLGSSAGLAPPPSGGPGLTPYGSVSGASSRGARLEPNPHTQAIGALFHKLSVMAQDPAMVGLVCDKVAKGLNNPETAHLVQMGVKTALTPVLGPGVAFAAAEVVPKVLPKVVSAITGAVQFSMAAHQSHAAASPSGHHGLAGHHGFAAQPSGSKPAAFSRTPVSPRDLRRASSRVGSAATSASASASHVDEHEETMSVAPSLSSEKHAAIERWAADGSSIHSGGGHDSGSSSHLSQSYVTAPSHAPGESSVTTPPVAGHQPAAAEQLAPGGGKSEMDKMMASQEKMMIQQVKMSIQQQKHQMNMQKVTDLRGLVEKLGQR